MDVAPDPGTRPAQPPSPSGCAGRTRRSRRWSGSSARRPTSATCWTGWSTCSRRCRAATRASSTSWPGDRLKLRAASPVYGSHVGRIEFGVDEGLAGWSVRHRQAAVIQDRAMDDPRTNFVPELEEERFQSIAAVPVPSRSGEILGVIVLHTAAPHEFDESTLKVLPQTASLIAGAIENAKLFEEAQHRVEALTRLSRLSQRIAAVTRRAGPVPRRHERHPRGPALRRLPAAGARSRRPAGHRRRRPASRRDDRRVRRHGGGPARDAPELALGDDAAAHRRRARAGPRPAARGRARGPGRGRRRVARGARGRGARGHGRSTRRTCCAPWPTRSRWRSRRPS